MPSHDGAGKQNSSVVAHGRLLIDAGPSHVHVAPQANLPLRQALRQPICAPEPKIHDITEKFLKASEGMFAPSATIQHRFTTGAWEWGRSYRMGAMRFPSLMLMHNRITESEYEN